MLNHSTRRPQRESPRVEEVKSRQEGLVIFRFFFDRPHHSRSPVEQQLDVPAATYRAEPSLIVMETSQVVDAVKGEACQHVKSMGRKKRGRAT